MLILLLFGAVAIGASRTEAMRELLGGLGFFGIIAGAITLDIATVLTGIGLLGGCLYSSWAQER